MNPLERALVEKAGHENGFENVLFGAHDREVLLGSARHRAEASITLDESKWLLELKSAITKRLAPELARGFPDATLHNGKFFVASIPELGKLLRRAARLAQALPTQAADNFESQVREELAKLPVDATTGTEVERMVRQRVGQNAFRNAMLDYWGGACALTGIRVPEVLRASHAKAWADCDNDAERLDVFNGFLLCANLDALFDRFLITFDDSGKIMISTRLSRDQHAALGLNPASRLRWIANEHLIYLHYHRSCSWKGNDKVRPGKQPKSKEQQYL
ncbi:MAG: HNH endonuclease [Methylococcales bacterium]